jgi:hypothetical protein
MNNAGVIGKVFSRKIASAMAIGVALAVCMLAVVAAVYGQASPRNGSPASGPAASAPASAPASVATPYVLILIKGVIGNDFSADRMESLVDGAVKAKVSTIVLDLNTPGGSTDDARRIVEIIIAHKDIRFIAFVRRALSAGATITLACKDIYVTEGATIGAAVSFVPDPSGKPTNIPKDVAEKFQSAWRADCRKAAECGGHPSIIAEAMVDPDFALTMRKDGDKVICERNGKGDVLKASGRILTLTGREAVSCQLAKKLVADLPALEKELSLSPVAAADAVDNPGAFYHEILQKAAQLKMADKSFAGLTSFQRDSVEKEWDAWYKEESKKFFPRAGSADSSLTLSLKLVEVGVPMTPQDIDRIKVQVAALTENYKKQTGPDYNADGLVTTKGVLQWQISHANAAIKRAAFYPLVAHAGGDEKVRVLAWIKPACADYLKRLAKGDPIVLSGRVFDVSFYHTKDAADGRLMLVPLLRPSGTGAVVDVSMEDCLAGEEAIQQAAAKTTADAPSADLEKQAQGKLSLALAYKANGNNARAIALLQAIITTCPNTAAAQQAKEELDNINSK